MQAPLDSLGARENVHDALNGFGETTTMAARSRTAWSPAAPASGVLAQLRVGHDGQSGGRHADDDERDSLIPREGANELEAARSLPGSCLLLLLSATFDEGIGVCPFRGTTVFEAPLHPGEAAFVVAGACGRAQ